MGLFGRIRNAASFAGDSVSNPSGWLARLLASRSTSSGVTITEENALTVSDVYKCVRVISEAVAKLPWKLYRTTDDGGREELKSHPLYFLLHDEPNDLMTSFTYREAFMGHLLLRGKHFSYIERDGGGRPFALWPILPHRCRFEVRDGIRWFFASTQGGAEVKFWDDEILYIPGMTRDGYNTYAPIELHRETLGLSKASEIFGAKFFGNGSHSGGFLKHPKSLTPEAAARLKKSWEDRNSGLDSAHRVTVLEEGMDFTANTIPPDQAQFLQTRKFQRSEIAGIFGVPPHKIGDLERSTNNNIEHQELEFYTDCIAGWLERIEQACNRGLLLPREKGKVYNEFDIDAMMRGDTAAQIALFQGMFNTASITSNEIRRKRNLPPVEGGDQLFVPMNMVPLDKAAELAAAKSKQPAAAPGAGNPAEDRVKQANTRFFRDAMARIVNREPAQRQKYAETALKQPVLSLFECVLGEISDDLEAFAVGFASTLAAESLAWDVEKLDETVSAVVERGIQAALERGSN